MTKAMVFKLLIVLTSFANIISGITSILDTLSSFTTKIEIDRNNVVTAQYCDRPPCFPVSQLFQGYDMATGTFKNQVLAEEWTDDRYYNPNNGETYQLQRGVYAVPIANSIIFTGTLLFNSTSSIEQWQATQIVSEKDYILGMSSHTTMTYTSIDMEYGQARNTNYVIQSYGFVEVTLDPNAQILSPMCALSVEKLPEVYDQIAYTQFIDAYGTHYITNGDWGVRYKFLSNLKTCVTHQQTQEYVYENTQTDGWISSSQHTTYSGKTTTDDYYSSRRTTMQMFEGGLVSLQNSATWNEWVSSGADFLNILPLAFDVRPIYDLMNGTKRDNMIRATNEYFQTMYDRQAIRIEEARLAPKSVAYAVVYPSYSNGMYIPVYKVLPTSIQLNINESSPIIGSGGSCNDLKYNYIDPYTKYYIGQFRCRRDGKSGVIAENVFNSAEWVTSQKGWNDDCRKVSVKKTYHDLQYSELYAYSGNSGYMTTSYDNSGGTYLPIEYYIKSPNSNYYWPYTFRTFDGYMSETYSSTSATPSHISGNAVCVAQCEYFVVSYDSAAQPIVQCSC